MKLEEYIEKSLVAIAKGVREAQEKAEVTIAPARIEGREVFEPQNVKFEVEVMTSAEGGGSINVLGMAEVKGGGSGHNTHRLTFEVPMYLNSENVYRKLRK